MSPPRGHAAAAAPAASGGETEARGGGRAPCPAGGTRRRLGTGVCVPSVPSPPVSRPPVFLERPQGWSVARPCLARGWHAARWHGDTAAQGHGLAASAGPGALSLGSPPGFGFGSVWGGLGAPRGCCGPLAAVMSWAGLTWAGAIEDVAEATPALSGPQSTRGGSVTPRAAQLQPFPRLIPEPGGPVGAGTIPVPSRGTAPSLPSWSSWGSPLLPPVSLRVPPTPRCATTSGGGSAGRVTPLPCHGSQERSLGAGMGVRPPGRGSGSQEGPFPRPPARWQHQK